MNVNNTPVIWTVVIATIVMLLAGFWGVGSINKNLQLATAEVPTADDIANAVITEVTLPTVPTAQEIADLIEVPTVEQRDTDWSVRDAMKVEAERLFLEEMDDDDFKEELTAALELAGGTDIDLDEDGDDIGAYDIRDIDYDVVVDDEEVYVTVEFKVDFENYGDETETARFDVEFEITDLDWDDDFEDAEISDAIDLEFVRFYGDLND